MHVPLHYVCTHYCNIDYVADMCTLSRFFCNYYYDVCISVMLALQACQSAYRQTFSSHNVQSARLGFHSDTFSFPAHYLIVY